MSRRSCSGSRPTVASRWTKRPSSTRPALRLKPSRAAALEQVLRLAEITPHFILATHALFRWRNALIPGFDVHYLNQVQPDLYVTISDTITAIKGRLDRQARWRQYSYHDLLIWRDEETFVTEMMARLPAQAPLPDCA